MQRNGTSVLPPTKPAPDLDWSKPVFTFEEVRDFLGYAETTAENWCREHRDFCQRVGKDRKFAIHRDGFIAWLRSESVDWSQPVLTFEQAKNLLGYSDEYFKKWCRNHREFCQLIGGGSFLIDRDGLLAWLRSDAIDWTQPVLTFEQVQRILGYAELTMKKWCRAHREFCQPTGDGRFIIHRDKFIEWIGSGPDKAKGGDDGQA